MSRPNETVARPWQGMGLAVIAVLAGNALLIASAKTQVPFWPVPMTMQPLVAVLIGLAMGSRLGALTVGAYLLEGALGLPVFAGTPERGIGLAYLAGPTGGYLVGFLAAAWLAGLWVDRGRASTLAGRAAAMLCGFFVIYALGFAWLATIIGPARAVTVGILPFLLGDAVKLALGLALTEGVIRVRRNLMK